MWAVVNIVATTIVALVSLWFGSRPPTSDAAQTPLPVRFNKRVFWVRVAVFLILVQAAIGIGHEVPLPRKIAAISIWDVAAIVPAGSSESSSSESRPSPDKISTKTGDPEGRTVGPKKIGVPIKPWRRPRRLEKPPRDPDPRWWTTSKQPVEILNLEPEIRVVRLRDALRKRRSGSFSIASRTQPPVKDKEPELPPKASAGATFVDDTPQLSCSAAKVRDSPAVKIFNVQCTNTGRPVLITAFQYAWYDLHASDGTETDGEIMDPSSVNLDIIADLSDSPGLVAQRALEIESIRAISAGSPDQPTFYLMRLQVTLRAPDGSLQARPVSIAIDLITDAGAIPLVSGEPFGKSE